ncbi:hypothetical protein Vretimale_17557 [Volvox reticuliferus]|uniref:Uncharacterized protein n=1 Tax=Volvox reticuliferus TaxID=1737510 RepID=A0A8J4LXE4_9CHLO|nr:hypothetical protein Vretimale_17557 [Volvox reticuliferus]
MVLWMILLPKQSLVGFVLEAKEGYRINYFEALVDECKSDPKALWARLENKGPPPFCPIQDIDLWAGHFDKLFNGEVNNCNVNTAEEILCVINSQSKSQGKDWLKSSGFKLRSQAAVLMDEPFSASEVGKAIQRLSNGKSGGLGKIPAECLKKATRLVDDKEVNVMVVPLRSLFDHIRSMNDFPVQFEVAASAIPSP